MEISTTVAIPAYPFSLPVGGKIAALGSCFAQEIADRLLTYKFDVCHNPMGILFHPMALARCLELATNTQVYSERNLVEHDGLFHSFDHHSAFSGTDAQAVVSNINKSLIRWRAFLKDAQVLVLTLGTAHVYDCIEDHRTVANCHRMPARLFEKRRLHVNEMSAALSRAINKISESNKGLQVILTVSPVRHIKDGLIENQKSKSALVLTCDELVRTLENVHYFPVYELFMDEWRDYRYYSDDLIHPSSMAVSLVWDTFCQFFLSRDANAFVKAYHKLSVMLQHKVRFPGSESHQRFIFSVKNTLSTLQAEYSMLDWSDEEASVGSL